MTAFHLTKRSFLMTITYSNKVATRFGINAALVASYLYERIGIDGKRHHGRVWFRCAKRTLTAFYPFCGVCAVSSALKRLIDNGVLVKREYNVSRFDRTLSYAFTDYGRTLMEEE